MSGIDPSGSDAARAAGSGGSASGGRAGSGGSGSGGPGSGGPGSGGAGSRGSGDLRVTERVEAGPAGPGRGHWGPGQVGQKAMDFTPSLKRLVGRLRPERTRAIWVVVLIAASTLLNSFGPRVLGHATDLIFNGLIGMRLPAGATKAQVVAGLRDQGKDRFADMIAAMDLVPGVGVDFDAVARVLGWVLALYAVSAVLGWLAGYIVNDVVQQTVRRMRDEVEEKVHRLPLSFFDRQPRGELLSRVTNDIDNVSQTLQQTMSQLLNSLFMVVSVLAMMVWISPLLALVALISVPLSVVVSGRVMKRSQKLFVEQWRRTVKP